MGKRAKAHMDRKKFVALNRAYMPKSRTDMLSYMPEGVVKRYSSRSRTRSTKLLKESRGRLESSLEIGASLMEPWMYASLVYFNEEWHSRFNRERTQGATSIQEI